MKSNWFRIVMGAILLCMMTSCNINWRETFVSQPYTAENLLVEISSTEKKYNLDEPIWIEFSITNLGNETVRVNRLHSPLEGKFTEDYFSIYRKNDPVYYTGKRLKKRRAILASTIALQPGERVMQCVDVQEVYSFTNKGKYQVQFRGSRLNHLPDSEEIEIKVK
ncbi:MAG: hypothetical protein AAFQ83_11770 [Bacteroidota bacterium]